MAQVHGDRIVVALVDRRNEIVADGVRDVIVFVHDRVPRKDHIVGAEGRPVMPPDTASQMVDDRLAVRADAAVAQRRHLGCQVGHEFVAIAPVEEESAPKEGEIGIDLLGADDRIERVGLLYVDDAQEAMVRPRIPAGRARLGADTRAGGRREKREQRRDRKAGRQLHNFTITLIASRASIAA